MSDAPGTDPGVPVDALDHVRTDGEALLRIAVEHDLDCDVPSCPGWTLGDLTWHVGTVWNRWARVVAERVTSDATVRAWGAPERPTDELLVDWVTAAHTALFSALSRAAIDQEVWTWTGSNQDVRWVRRRMAHETAVHRWDAAHAVGLPDEIPAVLAVDGIDEFLELFVARDVATDTPPLAGTVHLHCTDTSEAAQAEGEWLITSLDRTGATFSRQHAKGDVAVRGRASDLFLWVWGRTAGPVEIFGDAELAETFRNYGRR
jgi:uncharacterized protein (TIGR03083 family)